MPLPMKLSVLKRLSLDSFEEWGITSPHEFLAIAEENGLIKRGRRLGFK